jgi:hypothetical protein
VLYLVGLGFIGLASSLTWPAIFGNTVLSVPIERYAAATSINQTAQRMATAAGAAIAVSLIGEAPVTGVGNYDRIFVLAAIGGVMAVVIGSFMRSSAVVVREPVLTS